MIWCVGYYLVDYELLLFVVVVGKMCMMEDYFIIVSGIDVIDVFCFYLCLLLGLGMLDVFWLWFNFVFKVFGCG